MSDVTTHPNREKLVTGDVIYSITAGIERKQLYIANISLVGSDQSVIQVLKLNFSEFWLFYICNYIQACSSF